MAVGSQLVGIATGVAVKKASDAVISSVWRKTARNEPPADPSAPGTPWGQALSWAVASGIAVAVGRLVATRGAATVVTRLTGRVPEGMEPPTPKYASALRR